MSQRELVGYIFETLAKDGVAVQLHPNSFLPVESGGTASGYFDDEEKKIDIAAGRDDWVEVLAHEFCHTRQWLEGLFNDETQMAAYAYFDTWLQRKRELTPDTLKRFIRSMQWLEWDNEKRTVELLKHFEVPFDEEVYIQKANAYVWSYEMCRKIRRWHDNSPYDVKDVISLVPTTFLDESQFGELPPSFEEKMIQHCYEFVDNTNYQEE